MVAGDLVNTAVAHPVGGRAGHGARRRGDAPRDRGDDRLRGRGRARAEGQGRAGSALARAARRRGRARRSSSRRASRRRSSAATASCASSRTSSTPPPTSARRTSSRSPASPGSASRGSAGSSTSTSTGSPRPSGGTAAAASPTARASPTGRSPRWCACAAGSPRTRTRRPAPRSSAATLDEHVLDADERAFVEPRLAQLLGLEAGRAGRAAAAVRGVAALLRAHGRHEPGRARVRGPAVGGREPARLRRVPARVVAQPPDLRASRSRAPSCRAAADLGRRPAQRSRRSTSSRCRRRDGGAARRARARAARRPRASRSSRAPRASRSTRSRRCACCSTAACSPRTGASTASSARSSALDVPETLHALIAARLDGLDDGERALVQDAAVLGKTFSAARCSRASRAGPRTSVEALLASLVRKEVLSLQADPRSPEHGQYGFLQDLVRRVAYETLARRDRKAAPPRGRRADRGRARRGGRARGGGRPPRRRATTRHRMPTTRRRSSSAPGGCTCWPASAPSASPRPARRSGSSSRQRSCPTRHVRRAGADRPRRSHGLGRRPRRGRARRCSNARATRTTRLAMRSRRHSSTRGSQRSTSTTGATRRRLRADDARARRRSSGSARRRTSPRRLRSSAASSSSPRDYDAAAAHLERALALAEELELPETLAQALNSKSVLMLYRRPAARVAAARPRRACGGARARPARPGAARVQQCRRGSLVLAMRWRDGIAIIDEALEYAQRTGERVWELSFLAGSTGGSLDFLGRWDEALERGAAVEPYATTEFSRGLLLLASRLIHLRRGDVALAREIVDRQRRRRPVGESRVRRAAMRLSRHPCSRRKGGTTTRSRRRCVHCRRKRRRLPGGCRSPRPRLRSHCRTTSQARELYDLIDECRARQADACRRRAARPASRAPLRRTMQ